MVTPGVLYWGSSGRFRFPTSSQIRGTGHGVREGGTGGVGSSGTVDPRPTRLFRSSYFKSFICRPSTHDDSRSFPLISAFIGLATLHLAQMTYSLSTSLSARDIPQLVADGACGGAPEVAPSLTAAESSPAPHDPLRPRRLNAFFYMSHIDEV